MAAPNLTATVPPNQRFRVVYRLQGPVPALFPGAADWITERWYDQPAVAVVIAPATTPAVGGTTRFTGPREAFTSIDIKTPHTLQTVTWDVYLAPFRRPGLGIFALAVNAELSSVELLSPGALSASVAPVARTTASEQPAQRSLEAARSRFTNLGAFVNTATKRVLFAGLIVLGIVVAWKMGPQLMALVKRRK